MTTATFPQVIVEAGFVPTTPGTGNLTLLLDDGVNGLLDTDELAGADVWTDITTYVQSGTTTRTMTRQLGPLVQFQGGTATLVLNNSDGRFDPANLTGPYVAAGATQVRPMIPVRVRAIWDGTTYYLYSGFAISWTPPAENFGPAYDQTTLVCSDAFRAFTGTQLATLVSGVGASELSGARISRILLAAGWYTTAQGMSVISAGDSAMQATTYGSDALSLMQLTADSELGELYVDGQGRVVFRARRDVLQDTRSNTVQGVFGGSPGTSHPNGTEVEATLLARPDDDTTMFNDIQAQNVGSVNLQEVKDATAIAKYLFPRTYQRTDLILTTDTDALSWANYVGYLAAGDEFRFDQLTITPGVDPADLYPQVLGRELGDLIEVWKRPPGVTAYSKDVFVRGITHTFTPTWWQTVWDTQNAARYSFLVLDNATLGQLDDNALAW
jgi:hypothetical protein